MKIKCFDSMNAKDAYQNSLWNKLPYDLKQSIFTATENGDFSVTVKVTRSDKNEVSKWILSHDCNTFCQVSMCKCLEWLYVFLLNNYHHFLLKQVYEANPFFP